MQTLKCSRWTMFPTACASRSYCFSFSGAFMTLVYSPHAFREIGVVRGDGLGHRAAQQRQVLRRRRGSDSNLGRGVIFEPRLPADVARLVLAFEPEAALVLLPGEKRLAGEQRRGVAARRDEFHLRHEDARRVLLAKQDGFFHRLIHICGAERAGEPLALRTHEVDVPLAVDLRAAKEEDVDTPLSREVEELARALGEGIAFSFM